MLKFLKYLIYDHLHFWVSQLRSPAKIQVLIKHYSIMYMKDSTLLSSFIHDTMTHIHFHF